MSKRDDSEFTQFNERLAKIDFGPILFKLVEEHKDLSRSQLCESINDYKNFLRLNFLHPDETLACSKMVDLVWHTHILDTEKYHADCMYLFGGFLHHFPYFGLRGAADAQELQNAFDKTKLLTTSSLGLTTGSGSSEWLPTGKAAGCNPNIAVTFDDAAGCNPNLEAAFNDAAGCNPNLRMRCEDAAGCNPNLEAALNDAAGCNPNLRMRFDDAAGCNPNLEAGFNGAGCNPNLEVRFGDAAGCNPNLSMACDDAAGCNPGRKVALLTRNIGPCQRGSRPGIDLPM